MMQTITIAASGCAAGVGWHAGRWQVAWGGQDGRVLLWDSAGVSVVRDTPRNRLAYARLCGPWLAYRDVDEADHGWAVLRHLDTGRDEIVGACAGNAPIALSETTIAWQQPGWSVWARALEGHTPWLVGPGAPTGLAYLERDPNLGQDLPVLTDAVRYGARGVDGAWRWTSMLRRGVLVPTDPARAPGLTVACHPCGGILFRRDDGRELWLLPGSDTREPQVAVAPDGTAGVVSWGDDGVRLVLVGPEEGAPWQAWPQVGRLPRAVLAGWFKGIGRDGDWVRQALEGGATILFGGPGDYDRALPLEERRARFDRAAREVIARGAALCCGSTPGVDEVEAYAPYWDHVACVWVTTEEAHETWDLAAIENQVERMERTRRGLGLPRRPYLCYLDTDLSSGPYRVPRGIDWQAVRGYLTRPMAPDAAAEALADLVARQIDVVPAHVPVLLIGQAYDMRQPWDVAALEAMQPVIAGYAAHPRVVGVGLFAYARAGGARDHPELVPHAQALFLANPGRPPIVTLPEETAVPELTIRSVAPTRGVAPFRVRAEADLLGHRFDRLTWQYRRPDGPWQAAAVNPADDLDHTFTFTEPGEWEIGLRGDGPDGSAETGARRVVRVESASPRLPTYAEFLETEGPAVDAAYRTLGGDRPTTGDVRHTAWRRLVEGWPYAAILADIAPAPPSPDPPNPGPSPSPGVEGPTRRYGSRGIGDERGPRNWLILSRFALALEGRDGWRQKMDHDRAAGYHGERCFCQVESYTADSYWTGRELKGDRPDLEELIGQMVGDAADRGLRLWLDLFGKGGTAASQSSRLRILHRLMPILRERASGILAVGMMNEPGDYITPGELFELYDAAQDMAPDLVLATGAAWTEPGWDPEDPGMFGNTAFSPNTWERTQRGPCLVIHYDRSEPRPEGEGRVLRQPYEGGQISNRIIVDLERSGPGSSAGDINEPRVLRSQAAISFLCRNAVGCLHGKPGIRGDEGWDWETTPGYLTVPRSLRWLPDDLANGTLMNAQARWTERPCTLPDSHVVAVSGQGCVRCYINRAPDGRHVIIPFAPVSEYPLVWEFAQTVTCYQQDRDEPLWTREVGTGETTWLHDPELDYLLVSQRR